jgi:hypothetical protein
MLYDDYKSKIVVSWWFLECMYTMLQIGKGMESAAKETGQDIK